jgi:hypothetical protein
MSNLWVRMALLLILRNQAPRSDLLNEITAARMSEPRCPGKNSAVLNWYRLPHPETGRFVGNFDVCPACCRSLETLFPALRGTFRLSNLVNPSIRRTCDLDHHSSNFANYIDALEIIANQAREFHRPPNMLRFVELVKELSSLPECTRDHLKLNQPWHFMPHLPEFTVCEACYDEVVYPAISGGSTLADEFHRTMQLPTTYDPMGASCQLYSPRMRDVFEACCRRNDFQTLRAEVLHRVKVEKDLRRMMHTKALPQELKEQEILRLLAEWQRLE